MYYRRKIEFRRDWGIGLSIGQFGDGGASLVITPIYGTWFIPLPFRLPEWDRMYCIAPSFGFDWKWSGYRGDLFLNWWTKCKIIHMPWTWEHVRHEVLMSDGKWRRVKRYVKGTDPFTEDYSPWNWTDKFEETHDYTYIRKNGEVQKRKATIGVEEREWRWRWLTWLPFPRKVSRYIEIRFDDEVGERSGTWKGGCIGCSYDMNPGETPLDTLRRMERERKFT